MTGGAEGLKIGRIRIRSHINLNFILQQSPTAFGGAPFTQGSLSRYHAFGLLDKPNFSLRPSTPTKPLALPPSIDTHQALGSPDGRAGAKRLRGLTAPIPYTKLHSCTNCLHNPLPLPSGGTSPKGRGKGCEQTSSIPTNRNYLPHPLMPTAPLKATSHGAMKGDMMFLSALDIISQSCRGGKILGKSS